MTLSPPADSDNGCFPWVKTSLHLPSGWLHISPSSALSSMRRRRKGKSILKEINSVQQLQSKFHRWTSGLLFVTFSRLFVLSLLIISFSWNLFPSSATSEPPQLLILFIFTSNLHIDPSTFMMTSIRLTERIHLHSQGTWKCMFMSACSGLFKYGYVGFFNTRSDINHC